MPNDVETNLRADVAALHKLLLEITARVEALGSSAENADILNRHIAVVRKEVIEPIVAALQPIRAVLDENRAAVKFSKLGFWIGAFGVLISVVSLLYVSFKPQAAGASVDANKAVIAAVTDLQGHIDAAIEARPRLGAKDVFCPRSRRSFDYWQGQEITMAVPRIVPGQYAEVEFYLANSLIGIDEYPDAVRMLQGIPQEYTHKRYRLRQTQALWINGRSYAVVGFSAPDAHGADQSGLLLHELEPTNSVQ
jgi:hypothetical protein